MPQEDKGKNHEASMQKRLPMLPEAKSTVALYQRVHDYIMHDVYSKMHTIPLFDY